jgi:hypothetical protein
MAQASSMSASCVALLVASRILSFWNWCSHDSDRSTSHLFFPSPPVRGAPLR